MDTLLKADIFFFVTTIAVVIFAALFTVAIIYLIKILKDARHIAGVARAEADRIAEDIATLREKAQGGASRGLSILTSLISLWQNKKKKSRSRK